MRAVSSGLAGHESRTQPVGRDNGPCVKPIRYAFRSFDRHWIIPDNRLINHLNPQLWEWYSERQVHLTAFMACAPSSGPAITFCGIVPDLHHDKGNFGGRAFPLLRDSESNLRPALLAFLAQRYGQPVSGEDLMAYLAAIAANPAFTARFQPDLV